MNPGHLRRPQIIRLLAAVLVAVLRIGVPAVAAQPTPCTACLVIGTGQLLPAGTDEPRADSLNGVSILLTGDASEASVRAAAHRLANAGAAVGVTAASGEALDDDLLRDVSLVVVTPIRAATAPAQVAFDARTSITAWRAAKPAVTIAIDGDAFAAAGVDVAVLVPYTDAVIR